MLDKKKYIGIMSGSSLDAIDVALLVFDPITLVATHSEAIPTLLKEKLLRLSNADSEPNEIDHMGEADVLLGRIFAQAVNRLLEKNKILPESIEAIGSHGHTIRHRPHQAVPFTLQIGDPHAIAALTGITTIADFRRRDMVWGGQAAPLAPLFHAYLWNHCTDRKNRDEIDCWILNIGGIANVTALPQDKSQVITGFDTGPGNVLLDTWIMQHLGKAYDDEGAWAASGTIQPTLLETLLSDSYFQRSPPKSTGREYFNLSWLQSYLKSLSTAFSPADIQATLLELTAQSFRRSIHFSDNKNHIISLCGGGSRNRHLVRRLLHACHPYPVSTTLELTGLHPDWVEAACFAWLAKQTCEGKAGNCPSVTGAQKSTILGAIYPSDSRIPHG